MMDRMNSGGERTKKKAARKSKDEEAEPGIGGRGGTPRGFASPGGSQAPGRVRRQPDTGGSTTFKNAQLARDAGKEKRETTYESKGPRQGERHGEERRRSEVPKHLVGDARELGFGPPVVLQPAEREANNVDVEGDSSSDARPHDLYRNVLSRTPRNSQTALVNLRKLKRGVCVCGFVCGGSYSSGF